MNLSEVNTHLLAAIFIDSKAICYAVIWVWESSARAAHSANCPPDPTPIVSLIYRTFPVPSNSTIRFLSITIRVASRWRKARVVRHCLAYVTQAFNVCLGCLLITVSRPYISVNASAREPANPQYMPYESFLILRPSTLTLVLPCETWPSPMMTVSPLRFNARIVVWCHSLAAEKLARRFAIVRSIIIITFLYVY